MRTKSATSPCAPTSPALPIGPHWMIIWPYAYPHICGTPRAGNEYTPDHVPVWTMRYAAPAEPSTTSWHANLPAQPAAAGPSYSGLFGSDDTTCGGTYQQRSRAKMSRSLSRLRRCRRNGCWRRCRGARLRPGGRRRRCRWGRRRCRRGRRRCRGGRRRRRGGRRRRHRGRRRRRWRRRRRGGGGRWRWCGGGRRRCGGGGRGRRCRWRRR